MNEQQILNTIATKRVLANNGLIAYQQLLGLLARAERSVKRNEFQQPITQAELDYLVAQYTPLYTAALANIKTSTAALGITIP